MGESQVDDLGLMVVIWVDDPSFFGFWVDDPVWVGDPEDAEEPFLIVGSSRANLNPFPELRPPLREVPVALGGITTFL